MIVFKAYVDDTNEVYQENMKEVWKQVNETEAKNQPTKMNDSTLEENQNGSSDNRRSSNETVKEENSLLPEGYGNGTAENSGLR